MKKFTCTYSNICTSYIYIYIYIYTRTHARTHARMHAKQCGKHFIIAGKGYNKDYDCMYVLCICMYICMYIYIYIYIYSHTAMRQELHHRRERLQQRSRSHICMYIYIHTHTQQCGKNFIIAGKGYNKDHDRMFVLKKRTELITQELSSIVSDVVIGVPSLLLQAGISFLDTPGTGVSKAQHYYATITAMEKATVIIILTDRNLNAVSSVSTLLKDAGFYRDLLRNPACKPFMFLSNMDEKTSRYTADKVVKEAREVEEYRQNSECIHICICIYRIHICICIYRIIVYISGGSSRDLSPRRHVCDIKVCNEARDVEDHRQRSEYIIRHMYMWLHMYM